MTAYFIVGTARVRVVEICRPLHSQAISFSTCVWGQTKIAYGKWKRKFLSRHITSAMHISWDGSVINLVLRKHGFSVWNNTWRSQAHCSVCWENCVKWKRLDELQSTKLLLRSSVRWYYTLINWCACSLFTTEHTHTHTSYLKDAFKKSAVMLRSNTI